LWSKYYDILSTAVIIYILQFLVQIWLPDDFFITDSAYDEKFRNFIKSNIGKFRRTTGAKQKAVISMPKFSIEYSDNMVNSLQSIGIEKVFDQNEADLSPMLGNNVDGFVSNVAHGVKFDFDEKGINGFAVPDAEDPRYYTSLVLYCIVL